jgi:hypothetical protein
MLRKPRSRTLPTNHDELYRQHNAILLWLLAGDARPIMTIVQVQRRSFKYRKGLRVEKYPQSLPQV